MDYEVQVPEPIRYLHTTTSTKLDLNSIKTLNKIQHHLKGWKIFIKFFNITTTFSLLNAVLLKNLRHCYLILHWLLMKMLKVEGAPHYYWDRGESGAHESRARVESSAWLEAGAGWEEWWQVVMRVSTTTSLHLHYSSAHDPLMDDAGTGNIDMLYTCTSSLHSFISN